MDELEERCERQLIGAIDQGTSSTRFLVFESGTGQLVASSQLEIKRIVPNEGWVEIDAHEIIRSVNSTIEDVCRQLNSDDLCDSRSIDKLRCIGICNQRESTVVWDRVSGKPLYNVIVWMDNRTKDLVDQMIDSIPGRDLNWLKDKTGLPMSTYFSAFKLKWLIDNIRPVQEALKEDRLLFGTVDSWILWNLTGGLHMTDVTNASRTFLMDLETLDWDRTLCDLFHIPQKILPKILASADQFGCVSTGPLKGLPITGVIGDQSAALFGHKCLQVGSTKATFGTGCFIMQNIGPGPLSGALNGIQREAKRGLITTVGYKLGDRPACYALEGSIKIAGAALTWLRDNMQLIENYEECDKLVNQTTNSAGVFFVPALGGLYSPYWDPNATGLYIGLSQFSRREHLVRATFDSIAFQTNDILSLMRRLSSDLMIDGGLCKSDNLCQILADITGCDIVRPGMCETSALGAAMVAGFGAKIWSYDSMLAESKVSADSYGFSSSQYGTIYHHHPHETLNYDDRFSSLLQEKTDKLAQRSRPERADQPKLPDVAIESSDDTAIGDLLNPEAGGIELASTGTEDELDFGSSVETGESASDEVIGGDCDDHLNRPTSVYPATSSGYSSSDNLERNSLLSRNPRQDSPISEQLDAEKGPILNLRDKEPQKQPSIDSALSSRCDYYAIRAEECNLSQRPTKPVDVFQSYISLEHRTHLVGTWKRAVERSMNWTKIQHEELKMTDYYRLSSLPISVYLFFTVGMVALSSIVALGDEIQTLG